MIYCDGKGRGRYEQELATQPYFFIYIAKRTVPRYASVMTLNHWFIDCKVTWSVFNIPIHILFYYQMTVLKLVILLKIEILRQDFIIYGQFRVTCFRNSQKHVLRITPYPPPPPPASRLFC